MVKPFSFTLPPELVRLLDVIAEARGLSRSALTTRVIGLGLETLQARNYDLTPSAKEAASR
jgi:predicted transcriptional regulator